MLLAKLQVGWFSRRVSAVAGQGLHCVPIGLERVHSQSDTFIEFSIAQDKLLMLAMIQIFDETHAQRHS